MCGPRSGTQSSLQGPASSPSVTFTRSPRTTHGQRGQVLPRLMACPAQRGSHVPARQGQIPQSPQVASVAASDQVP